DTALRQAPIADEDAAEMFAEIRARSLLGPYRGMAPVRLDTLTRVIQAVGHIALNHPEIAEIDINPVMIQNGAPVAADALMVLRTP
ncbi:MAG: acetate--CoA ligase family protein, partial [Syntrophales bacterium]|nr:acetate--CoA ligase family protein [Syntrophales bacterium]